MSATAAREKVAKALPVMAVVVYGVLASVGAFTGGIWAIGGIGMALIAALSVWYVDGRFPQPEKKLIALAVLALGTMAALNLQSSHPHNSWKELLNLVTIFLPLALYSSPQIQTRLFFASYFPYLLMALVAGAFALGLELALDGPVLHIVKGSSALLNQYNRGLSYIVLLAFPVMAGLWRTKYRWAIIPFVLLLLFPAGLTESRTVKLALMVGILGAGLVALLPRKIRYVFAVLPAAVLAWPFLVPWVFTHHNDLVQHLPASWHHRVEIWDYMSYRVMERPWLGWGLGTSGDMSFAEPHGAQYQFATSAAPHPHNAVLQLWVELGVPGIVLGLLFAFYILWRALRLTGALAPFAVGAWLVGMLYCLTAYNFWTDSLYAAFALTGLAFAALEGAKGLFFATTFGDGVARDNPHNAQKIT